MKKWYLDAFRTTPLATGPSHTACVIGIDSASRMCVCAHLKAQKRFARGYAQRSPPTVHHTRS
jgi:hypothetical protein